MVCLGTRTNPLNFGDLGICGVKCCILLTCFVNMAIYDLEI